MECDKNNKNIVAALTAKTPQKNTSIMNDTTNTPRRSTRKSVRPIQDYNEIVGRTLRSDTKNKKSLAGQSQETDQIENEAPRWTPAKVGRVSQKRNKKPRKLIIEKNKENKDGGDQIKHVEQIDEMEKEIVENYTISNVETIVIPEMDQVDEMEKEIVENYRISNAETIAIPEMDQVDEIEKEIVENNSISNAETIEIPEVNQTDDMEKEIVENNSIFDVKTTVMPKMQPSVLSNLFGSAEKKSSEKIEEVNNCLESEKGDADETKSEEVEVSNGNESISEDLQENEISKLKSDSDTDTNMHTFANIKMLDLNCQDMEELGLKPLSVDEQENEDNDMSSLIFYDPQDVDGSEEGKEALNSTFNTSDCEAIEHISIITIADDLEDVVQTTDEIIINDFEKIESPKLEKPIVEETLNVYSTPKDARTSERLATPYKPREELNCNEQNLQVDHSGDNQDTISTISVTTLSPKNIVLRSLRKRSISLGIEGQDTTAKKCVTFYSPANETVVIEEFDLFMAETARKSKKTVDQKNITSRRKRSLSFDDSLVSSYIENWKPAIVPRGTPIKNRRTPQKPSSRTKLPNFAAIHEKQYNRMENIVEHMERKAERAKLILSSTSKLCIDIFGVSAAQKSLQIKDQTGRSNLPVLKSKVATKLQMDLLPNPKEFKEHKTPIKSKHDNKPTKSKVEKNTPIKPKTTSIKEKETKTDDNDIDELPIILPNSQLVLIKPTAPTITSSAKKPLKSASTNNMTTIIKKPMPGFNLSTALPPKPYIQSINGTSTNIKSNNPSKVVASTLGEKIRERRQKHMDMFKGRSGKESIQKDAIIRGVRSNRRFDLQMEHRKNLQN